MSITLKLPMGLHEIIGPRREFEINAETVRGAIRILNESYPGIYNEFFDDKDRWDRRFIIFVNNKTPSRDGIKAEEVRLSAGDRVAIIHAVSGG